MKWTTEMVANLSDCQIVKLLNESESSQSTVWPGEWQYCGECGCSEYENVDIIGKGYRTCKECGQEWWKDIDYTDTVRKVLVARCAEIMQLKSRTTPKNKYMKKGDYDPKYGYVNDQDMEGREPKAEEPPIIEKVSENHTRITIKDKRKAERVSKFFSEHRQRKAEIQDWMNEAFNADWWAGYKAGKEIGIQDSNQFKSATAEEPHRSAEGKYYSVNEVGNFLIELYKECEHGDEEHRQWLKDKFQKFFTNNIEVHSVKTIPNE